MTSDIWLSEDDSTNRLKPIQLVQSPSENDTGISFDGGYRVLAKESGVDAGEAPEIY